jgi:hypothetical protein
VKLSIKQWLSIGWTFGAADEFARPAQISSFANSAYLLHRLRDFITSSFLYPSWTVFFL